MPCLLRDDTALVIDVGDYKMNKIFAIFIVLLISCETPSKEKTNIIDEELDIESYRMTIDSAKAMLPAGVRILKEHVENSTYQAFYICEFENFPKVKYLKNFDFREHEMRTYNSMLHHVGKKKFSRIQKKDNHGLRRNWLPVYRYDDKYYTYAPSDWGNCGKRIITDSTFVHWYMDGPYPSLIQDIEKISEKIYKLKLGYIGLNKSSIVMLTISELIDPKHVWLFEFDYGEGILERELYVPIENANEINLIVNHSPMDKMKEFKFEKLKIDESVNNR